MLRRYPRGFFRLQVKFARLIEEQQTFNRHHVLYFIVIKLAGQNDVLKCEDYRRIDEE